MPRTPSTSDRFIGFLQQQLGQAVSVPDAVTDVPRSTRFPGLEGGSEDVPRLSDPNVGAFDASMLPQGGDGPSFDVPGLPDEEY